MVRGIQKKVFLACPWEGDVSYLKKNDGGVDAPLSRNLLRGIFIAIFYFSSLWTVYTLGGRHDKLVAETVVQKPGSLSYRELVMNDTLIPPASPWVPCAVQHHWKFWSQSREDIAIHNFFCNKTGGSFVELGALDGVQYSNTKFLEDHRQWSGLLIEAQPESAARLKRNRPRVVTIASAVCAEGVDTLTFTGRADAVSGSVNTMTDRFRTVYHGMNSNTYSVPCGPIGQMIRDANLTHVDLFSLDVEGGEFQVLETMDWNISVTLWVIELDGYNPQKDEKVRKLLKSHGYSRPDWNIRDFCCKKCACASNEVFVRDSYRTLR
jgi:FkbM family methyltransferase